MSGTNAIMIPSEDAYKYEACEGSCFSQPLTGLPATKVEKLESFQSFCASSEFSDFVTKSGITGASFEYNILMRAGHQLYDNFALNALDDAGGLAIVFHGTRESNIPNILANGLDPAHRKRQAYGAGEYFSKDPSVAVGYCNGSMKMLIFVVVVPAKRLGHSIVVVSRHDHQLPLGVLSFTDVNREAMHRAIRIKTTLQHLSNQAEEKERAAHQAKLKATIIQLLIQGHFDHAGEMYQKEGRLLPLMAKEEVSLYVHRLVDEEIIAYYFPQLPLPTCGEKLDRAGIVSVETLEKEANEAKERVAVEKAKLSACETNETKPNNRAQSIAKACRVMTKTQK